MKEEPTGAPETVPAAAEEPQPRALQPSEAQEKKEAEAAAVEASEGQELEKQNKKKAALAASARPKTKAKPAASAAPKVPAASAAPKVAVKSKPTSPAAPAGKKKVASDDSSYYEYDDDDEEESQEAPAIRLVEAKDVGERTSAAARSESESEEPVTKKELDAAVGSMKMYMGQMLAAQAATASASVQYWQPPPAAASASSGPSWGGRSESSKWLARKTARAQKYREAPSSSSAPRVVQTPMCRNCGKNQPGAFCQLGLCRPCCNSQWTPCEQHGAWR